MTRTFERSTRRRRRTLDGQWEFLTDPDDEGQDEGWAESFPSDDADTIAVPGSWNARPKYANYVGPAWYHREFTQPTETSVVFRFEAIGHTGTVFLDGEEILSTEGGYTPDRTYVRDLDAGSHDLVVRVDNRPVNPLVPSHWFPQGGLYREVVLEEVSGPWVSDLALDYDLDGDEARVEADVTLHNVSPTPSEATVVFGIDEQTTEASVEVGGLNIEPVTLELTLEDVERWSPSDPTLYDAVVAVRSDEGGDDRHERLGFREVAVGEDGVTINGDSVDLAGVNHNEDHPDWGHAEPLGVQQTDVDALTDAGFDLVRCADYPVHPRFLDLCDEAGVLVVEGVTPVEDEDVTPERFTDPADAETGSFEQEEQPVDIEEIRELRGGLADDAEADVEPAAEPPETHDTVEAMRRVASDMVERDRHHPSVVAWDVGSDYDYGPSVRETSSQLRGTVRGLDDSRLVTATTHVDALADRPEHAEHLDLASVTVGSQNPAKRLGIIGEYVENPVLVTGFGDVGVPGQRALADRPGTESRQATVLVNAVESLEAREDVAGFAIERFCDHANDAGAGPAPGTDYTGILTAHRDPKDAYRSLARYFGE